MWLVATQSGRAHKADGRIALIPDREKILSFGPFIQLIHCIILIHLVLWSGTKTGFYSS